MVVIKSDERGRLRKKCRRHICVFLTFFSEAQILHFFSSLLSLGEHDDGIIIIVFIIMFSFDDDDDEQKEEENFYHS